VRGIVRETAMPVVILCVIDFAPRVSLAQHGKGAILHCLAR